MKYSRIEKGQRTRSPWRILSPDGASVIVKTAKTPAKHIEKLTADAARKLAAEWSPDLEKKEDA